MEALGFHRIWSWELQLMEAMEASTSTVSGNFHLLPWKLPPTYIGVNLLPSTAMEASMEVNLLPAYFRGSWWKLLWKYVYFRLLPWKLQWKLLNNGSRSKKWNNVVGPVRVTCGRASLVCQCSVKPMIYRIIQHHTVCCTENPRPEESRPAEKNRTAAHEAYMTL